jgi:hypothetical protein
MRTLVYVAFPKASFTEKEARCFLRARCFQQRLETTNGFWRAVVSPPTPGGSHHTVIDEGVLFVFQDR